MEKSARKKNRTTALLIAAVLVALFAILACCVETGLLLPAEEGFYAFVSNFHNDALTGVILVITHLGDAPEVVGVCLILWLLPWTRRKIALAASVSAGFSAALNTGLKHLFARQRPDVLRLVGETGFSFPSGHSMNNAAIYVLLLLFAAKHIENKTTRRAVCVFFAAFVMLIGFSRIYLGVHYLGDVLGGWLFGTAVAFAVDVVFNLDPAI